MHHTTHQNFKHLALALALALALFASLIFSYLGTITMLSNSDSNFEGGKNQIKTLLNGVGVNLDSGP